MEVEVTLKLNDSQAGATLEAVNRLFWKRMKGQHNTPEQDKEMKTLNEVLIMFNIFFCDMLAKDRHPAREDTTTIASLRPGAVFVTPGGVYAVKSEYTIDQGTQCQCILLESGEYAWFEEGDNTRVREVKVDK